MRSTLLASAVVLILLAFASPRLVAADSSCLQPGGLPTQNDASGNTCIASIVTGGTASSFAGLGTNNTAIANTNSGGTASAVATGNGSFASAATNSGGTAIAIAAGNGSTAGAGPIGSNQVGATTVSPAFGDIGGSINIAVSEGGGTSFATSPDSSVAVAAFGSTAGDGFFVPFVAGPSSSRPVLGATAPAPSDGGALTCSAGSGGIGYAINLTTGQFCIAH